MNELGSLYLRGHGVAWDCIRVYMWFSLAFSFASDEALRRDAIKSRFAAEVNGGVKSRGKSAAHRLRNVWLALSPEQASSRSAKEIRLDATHSSCRLPSDAAILDTRSRRSHERWQGAGFAPAAATLLLSWKRLAVTETLSHNGAQP